MAQAPDQKKKPTHYNREQVLLYTLTWVVAVLILTSLFYSWQERLFAGASWDKLSSIGQFWGGHLSSIGLILLAFGLYMQRKQFEHQRKDSENQSIAVEKQLQEMARQSTALATQLRTLNMDIELRSAHYLLDGLRKLEPEMQFIVVIHHEVVEDQRFAVNRMPVVCNYLERKRFQQSEVEVFVAFWILEEYIGKAKAASALLEKAQASASLSEIHFLPVLEEYHAKMVKRREERRKEVESYSDVSESVKSELLMQIEQGRSLKVHQLKDSRYKAYLDDELSLEKRQYNSQDGGSETLEEALKDVLKVAWGTTSV